MCQSATPQSVDIKRLRLWEMTLGYEEEAFMNGISAHIKDTQESSLTVSSLWGHKKMPIYEPGSSPRSGDMILDFPASKTVRNKFLFFVSHLVQGILFHSNLNGLRQFGTNNK